MALAGLSATLTFPISQHPVVFSGCLIVLWAWNLFEDFTSANATPNAIAASTALLDDAIAILGWTLVVATVTCTIMSTQSGAAQATSNLCGRWWLRGWILTAGLLLTWRESSRQHESTGWALIGFALIFRASLIAPTALNLSDAFAVLCLHRMLRHIQPKRFPHPPEYAGEATTTSGSVRRPMKS